MFIDNKQISVAVGAAEINNGVVRETIIERAKPLARSLVIEIIDDMHVAPKRREDLPRRNIPITIQPKLPLPSWQRLQHADILRVVVTIIRHSRRDETRLRFLPVAKWHDIFRL